MMPKRTFDPTAPYQGINGAARISGISAGSIRAGCKVGKIPHVMVGRNIAYVCSCSSSSWRRRLRPV